VIATTRPKPTTGEREDTESRVVDLEAMIVS